MRVTQLTSYANWKKVKLWNGCAKKKKEASENGQSDPWSEVKFGENRQGAVEGMVKVGIPLLVTVIYGGILTILYVLAVHGCPRPIISSKVGATSARIPSLTF